MAADSGRSGEGGEPLAGRTVDSLGVADVVVSILSARRERPWATAAAVWRQRYGGVVHVRVILLDNASPPPAGDAVAADGRTEVIEEFAARRLNEDLITAFGARDVIILS